ncbi:hypothetical protein, partial [Burkholderia cenocepacia]|uniref:hypothetical protein n=1 Tax=Burkholderia cenocepacia TaxID=95486 RepID=UPI002AAFED70
KQRQQAIEQLFEVNLANLCEVFAETPAALGSESFPDYPGAVWTGDLGVNAFYVTQDVEVEQFPVYANLVNTGRERVGPCQFVRDGSPCNARWQVEDDISSTTPSGLIVFSSYLAPV